MASIYAHRIEYGNCGLDIGSTMEANSLIGAKGEYAVRTAWSWPGSHALLPWKPPKRKHADGEFKADTEREKLLSSGSKNESGWTYE
jgi:hypothetical protein